MSELESADPKSVAHSRVTVGDLIKRYVDEFEDLGRFGRSKLHALRQLQASDLARTAAVSLSQSDVVDHVRTRRLSGAGAATVNNDVVWLRVVFKAARSAWGIRLDLDELSAAAEACRQLQLIGRGRRRNRRPSPDELALLDAFFAVRDDRRSVPMRDLMWFAVFSSRRQAEICSITWADNDEAEQTGLVRDAKHPRRKRGNHRRFRYTPEAWAIVERQPRGDARIFPFNPKTVGTYFRDACLALEIDDLRFHDLRHEATSRLFEQGYSIVEVQQFTLHDDWNMLRSYTHLRPGDVVLR